MNIGFHYHFPFKLNSNGKIMTAGFLGLFIETLSQEVDSITLYAYEPIDDEEYLMTYEISSTNIIFISLGPHNSLPKRLFRLFKTWNSIRNNLKTNEIMLVRAPTPLLPFFYIQFYRRPFVQYIVGSYIAGNKTLKGNGIKNILIKIFNHIIEYTQRTIATRKTTIANSEKISTEYKAINENVYLLKTTTLTNKDHIYIEDKKMSNPLKLLYTGRLTPSKGLKEILDACILLQHEGIESEFHIAGIKEKGNEDFVENLIEYSTYNKYNNIHYHGFKNIGQDLNNLYRQSDIFLTMPKNEAEGFPRVIWEAMANSCPVIVSKSGSISYFLNNEVHAIILDNVEPILIKCAIKQLIENIPKTQLIIRNAYELAAENTQEKRCKELYSILKKELHVKY